MNKQEFLAKLRNSLNGVPQEEADERLTFYSELIDDYMEEGMTEQNAVAQLDTVESIAAQVLSEIPLTKLIKAKVKPNRTLRAWEIVLLVLGAPIWLSLLLALFAVAFSVYAVAWALDGSFWAIDLSIAVCALSGIFSAVAFAMQGNLLSAIALFGIAFMCAGLAIFGFIGCRCATKTVLALSKRFFMWVKACFMKREEEA